MVVSETPSKSKVEPGQDVELTGRVTDGSGRVTGDPLVLEARRPERRAWLDWTPERTRQLVDVPHEGPVEDWVEVIAVDEAAPGGPLVTFVSPTVFHRDGHRIDSTSTLRFRPRVAIERSLADAGLELVDVRDAPDRPGREWVYLARRPLPPR